MGKDEIFQPSNWNRARESANAGPISGVAYKKNEKAKNHYDKDSLPVTWNVHLPAPASLMTLQVYSPQPSRFKERMVYSVSSFWASKAPAWSSRLESSHSNRSTREGWARSTLQVITTGLPRPWRISMWTGSTVGGSEMETEKLSKHLVVAKKA